MSDRLVIIGCGAAKLPAPAPAAELYTGQHFRLCLATALTLAPRNRVGILSAWYGLLALDEVIAPYDLTIGQPGAIGVERLAEQAADRQLTSWPVVALCSRRYADLLRAVWSDVTAPLAGLGIGYQRAELARICREGLPA